MKKEIKKIQNYFVSKIEKGEFTLLEVHSDCSASIMIDEEYNFSLFFIKGHGVNLYAGGFENFILLPNDMDGNIFIDRVNAYQKLIKLQAIEKLKLEIEKL